MDSLFADWNRGVGGRSRVSIRKGEVCVFVSLDSAKTSREFVVSECAVIA